MEKEFSELEIYALRSFSFMLQNRKQRNSKRIEKKNPTHTQTEKRGEK